MVQSEPQLRRVYGLWVWQLFDEQIIIPKIAFPEENYFGGRSSEWLCEFLQPIADVYLLPKNLKIHGPLKKLRENPFGYCSRSMFWYEVARAFFSSSSSQGTSHEPHTTRLAKFIEK